MRKFFAFLKSRQMKLEGLSVERPSRFWWGNLMERDMLGDLIVDEDNIKITV